MAGKPDRKKVMRDYISGKFSYHDLAVKYKLSDSTVKRWSREDGWSRLKADASTKADQKIVEAVSGDAAEVAASVAQVAKELLEKLSTSLRYEGVQMDPSRIRQYTGALKDIQDITGDRNAIDLREQKARIAKLQQETTAKRLENRMAKAEMEKDADAGGVVVTMEGEAEQYAG